MKKDKVVFLLGPTGSGKSGLAVKLAKEFDGEIISADSVQIFKEFNIGSAKVTKKEMSGVRHYGLDLKEPNEIFSASEYAEYTKKCIAEINKKGKLTIVVGGTGLYIKSLTEGYNFGGTSRHDEFRAEMESIVKEKGLEYLAKILMEENSELARKIDLKNKVRVIRALEISRYGEEKSKKEESEFDYILLSTTMPREMLYERINKRVEAMLEEGLIEEVKSLYQKYGDCQPMTAIGYKEVLPYLKGQISKEDMIENIKKNTRHYAKRQMTFLRGLDNVVFIDPRSEEEIVELKENIRKWLTQ